MRKKLMDTRVNLVMDGELFKAFKALSADRGAPISELIRRAMREFIERRKVKA